MRTTVSRVSNMRFSLPRQYYSDRSPLEQPCSSQRSNAVDVRVTMSRQTYLILIQRGSRSHVCTAGVLTLQHIKQSSCTREPELSVSMFQTLQQSFNVSPTLCERTIYPPCAQSCQYLPRSYNGWEPGNERVTHCLGKIPPTPSGSLQLEASPRKNRILQFH